MCEKVVTCDRMLETDAREGHARKNLQEKATCKVVIERKINVTDREICTC